MTTPWFPLFPPWVWWACTGSNVLFGGQLVALAILWTLVARRRTAAERRHHGATFEETARAKQSTRAEQWPTKIWRVPTQV